MHKLSTQKKGKENQISKRMERQKKRIVDCINLALGIYIVLNRQIKKKEARGRESC